MLFSVYQEVFGHFPTIPDHFGRFPKFSKEKFENFRLPCGTKFLRVLIFASFAIFQAIRVEMLNELYILEALRHNYMMPGLLPGWTRKDIEQLNFKKYFTSAAVVYRKSVTMIDTELDDSVTT